MNMMKRNLLRGAAALALCAGGMAQAAVTADDVWQNHIVLYGATGGTLTGTPTRTGATLTVSDIGLDYALPYGFGSVLLRLGSMQLTENGDGTVALSYGTSLPLAFAITIAADLDIYIAGELTARIQGYSGQVSGDPGDMTYTTSVDMLTLTLDSLRAEGASDLQGIGVDGFARITDHSSTMRVVTTPDLVRIVSSGSGGQTITDFGFDMPGGIRSHSVSAIASTVSQNEIAIPRGPIDLMDLSQALRDGLAIRADLTTGISQSQSVMRIDNRVVSDQGQSTQQTEQGIAFDTDGLRMTGETRGVRFDFREEEILPGPITGAIARVSARFGLPVNASDAPQDAAFGLALEQIVLGDAAWDLFDAAGAFPRDPATLAFDMSGQVLVKTDLLDFATLVPFVEGGGIPVDLLAVALNRLDLSASGATLTGTGSFTIDNSDPTAFFGFPRPEGSAAFDLTGVNGLLDRVAGLGLVGEDELLGMRLGLGMIANVTGDDALTSRIEINDQGQIIVNGVRLQ